MQKIPKLQDLDDFISFIRFHIPQTNTKCLNMKLMDNYLEDSIIAIKGLEKIGALEINTTIYGSMWAKKTESFNSFTAKEVLDFIWDNKDSFDFTKQKEVKPKKLNSLSDVIDSLDDEIEIEEIPIEEVKKEKPIKEQKMETKKEKFCVFAEDMSSIEYFDSEQEAINYMNAWGKTAFMAKLLKKAVVKLVLEDV